MSKIGTQDLKLPSNLKITIIENEIEIFSKLGKVKHKSECKK